MERGEWRCPRQGLWAPPNPYLITNPPLPTESTTTLLVNTICCPALCVFAPLREALPGLYQQSPTRGEGELRKPLALDGRGVWGEGEDEGVVVIRLDANLMSVASQ
jgi:hypothetical protein